MSGAQPPALQKLGSLPRLTETHHWADYVELLCLVNIDGEFSPDDLVERWKGQDDLGEQFAEEVSADDDEGPLDAPSMTPGAPKAAFDDRRHRKAADVFEHLSYRAVTFGTAYPFDVDTGTLKRLRRRADLDGPQLLYVFLLLASGLRYVPGRRRHQVTTPFERLVAEALRQWLPEDAEVHIFGTSADDAGRYTGTMWEKITRLASDLGETVLLTKEDFNVRDTGDLGLDIVAWFPLGDAQPGLPVWFAQATCEAEWKHKQHESGRSWQSYLKESAPRGNLLFIPFCFRDPTGRWFDPKWPTASVIIDRQRMVWLLRNASGPLAPVPYDFVNEALAYDEAV